MYLALSTITALLECGSIFLGIHLGYSSGQILLLCFAYQFGNLFSSGFNFDRRHMTAICGLSCLLLIPAFLIHGHLWVRHGLLFLGIALLSIALQHARCWVKGRVSTVSKRLARMAGFLLSPVMGCLPIPVLSLCCIAVFWSLQHGKPGESSELNHAACFHEMRTNSVYHIMLWHQLHYFTYAYGVILVFFYATGHALLTMLFFSCTWLTYLMTEPLLHALFPTHDNHSNRRYLLIGHVFLLVILLLLPIVRSMAHFVVLWILTGFGGGTVFAITALCKESSGFRKEVLDYTENIGHFSGSGLAAALALLFPDSLKMLPYLSAVCVITVLTLTICNHKKGDTL